MQNERINDERTKSNNSLRDQIDELERSLKKANNENEENKMVVKELRKKCFEYEDELNKSHDANLQLIDSNHSLEKVGELNFKFQI